MSQHDSQSAPPSEDGGARQRLLQAAVKLFAQKGFEGTTTREIAQEAALNVSLISYYFGGKEGLYRAVIEDYAAHVRAEVEQFLALSKVEGGPTRETFTELMRALIERAIQTHLDYPEMKVVLFRELGSGMQHSRDYFDNAFFPIIETIKGIVENAQERGIVNKSLNPVLFLMMMIHTVDSFMMMSRHESSCRQYLPKIPDERAQLVDHLLTVMLKGGLA